MTRAPSEIAQVREPQRRMAVAREVLEALPEWFGIPEATERYIRESAEQTMVAAFVDGQAKGFLCLKPTGRDTVELAVMGVMKELHRQGIGRALFMAARALAKADGYSFLQVKTVQMGCWDEYDRTNRFYLSLGFKEFEVFPTLWDEANPCQIYVMALA